MQRYRLIAAVALLTVSACFQNWGTRLEFNGGELYYTPVITEAEANRLGEFLIESGFYDGLEKTVQITKTGSTYEFRMVIREGLDQDQEYLWIAGMYVQELSDDVFDGSRIDIHLCDLQLKTLRVIGALDFNGGELYYVSDVTEEEAVRLGEYLVETGFFDGSWKTVQIARTGDVYEFRMITLEGLELDQEYIEVAAAFAGELSEDVFHGNKMEIYFCDDQLQVLRVVTSQ